MILRVILKNFLSFNDEVQFDMFPNMKRTALSNHITMLNEKLPVLKMAAIYGANGAGKSNLLKGINFLKAIALNKSFLDKDTFGKYIFALKENTGTEPMELTIEFETKTGRNASDEEIAQELGIGEEELNDWQTQLNVTNVISLNEFVEQGGEPVMDAKNNSHFIQPEESVQEEELKKVLMESLELLTEKEKKVILLYYYEDLTLKEISSILEVSESRVSQLHTKALLKMRKKMGNYMGILID